MQNYKFYHLLMVVLPKDYMTLPTVLTLCTALSVLSSKCKLSKCIDLHGKAIKKRELVFFFSFSSSSTFLVKLILAPSCSSKQHLPTNTFLWCHGFGFSNPALVYVTVSEFNLPKPMKRIFFKLQAAFLKKAPTILQSTDEQNVPENNVFFLKRFK